MFFPKKNAPLTLSTCKAIVKQASVGPPATGGKLIPELEKALHLVKPKRAKQGLEHENIRLWPGGNLSPLFSKLPNRPLQSINFPTTFTNKTALFVHFN